MGSAKDWMWNQAGDCANSCEHYSTKNILYQLTNSLIENSYGKNLLWDSQTDAKTFIS